MLSVAENKGNRKGITSNFPSVFLRKAVRKYTFRAEERALENSLTFSV
jgi:hypothetical protein